jgi:hypothetical protein
MNNTALRKNLVELLQGGHAHVTPKRALDGFKPELRHVRPAAELRSVWEELEHIRLAQEDILRYTLDVSWKSPTWPAGYWPEPAEKLTDEKWSATVSGFFADLEEVIGLVKDPQLDLTTQIPHGEGRTYLREVLLVADHNVYHFGEIVLIRKLLGNWPG